jgi:hypothetical protein
MPTQRHASKRRLLQERELFVGAHDRGAPVTYWKPGGERLARVVALADDDLLAFVKDEIVRDLAEAWDVADDHGTVFSVRRYEASEHPSYDVVDADGQQLGTFFCRGGMLHEHVVVRDETSAPVAEMDTEDHVHELRARHGPKLAACRRTYDPPGNDISDEVWSVTIEPAAGPLDRRVLAAAPLVCHLIGHPKRHIDPDCTISAALLVAVPPVGGAMIVAERVMDGFYWLRRKLD